MIDELIAHNPILVIRCNPLDLEYVRSQVRDVLDNPLQWSLYGGFDQIPPTILKHLEAVLEPIERSLGQRGDYIWENLFTALNALDIFEQQYVWDLFSQFFCQTTTTNRVVIIQTDDAPIPVSLARFVNEFYFPLPTSAEIVELLKQFGLGIELKTRCSGLSHEELRRGLLLAANASDPKETLDRYRSEKLSLYGINIEPKPQVKEIGGLDRLVAEVEEIVFAFSEEARVKKLPYPRGWLLAGPPGTGKTHSARVIAGRLGFPMLSLSVDTIMVGGINAVKRVLAIAKSCSPCVLMLDEIEKMFANSEGEQLLGYLLTWANDKTDPIFLIGTLNRPGNLRIEITRAGRFDEVWEVPLPDEIPRQELFRIFLSNYEPRFAEDPVFTPQQWKSLANATLRFAPAEIQRVVDKTMNRLYREDLKAEVTVDDLIITAESFYSMYRRDEQQMLALQNAVAGKAVPAQSEHLKIFPDQKYHPFTAIGRSS
ncbi:AAA family ATPase [Merismopedia glauca]|uniref:AAA family ATPase n=1 Tax=Merismopedia glauca TaxID=292586 RepID=UPI0015E6ECB3|nr:AAA family ATPase [Merismopedia glauca]